MLVTLAPTKLIVYRHEHNSLRAAGFTRAAPLKSFPLQTGVVSKRKSEPIVLGDGPYYHPEASVGSIAHNYRHLFLSAIEKHTPEVLTSLRHRVWPAYDRLVWGVPYFPDHMWLYTFHPELAGHWMVNRYPEKWSERAIRMLLRPLKNRLFAWTSRYQIHVAWMLMQAMETMYYWTTFDSSPNRRRNDAELARMIARAMKMKPLTAQQRQEQDSTSYSWNSQRRWFFPKDSDQQFGYSGWHGEDEREYEARVRAEFEKHLSEYLARIRTKAESLGKTPVLRRPEKFEMLALYLCRNQKREQIAEAGFHKDLTAIYRDLKSAASLLRLSLRPPGR